MTNKKKKDIRSYDLPRLTDYFSTIGAKPFHAKQLYNWLWVKGCSSFDAMTNLSTEVRQILNKQFSIEKAIPYQTVSSKDGTIKVQFRFHDEVMAEGVLIPSGKRMTACISSQAGCALGCKFCATGDLGFIRNLSTAEIIDQVHHLNALAEKHYEHHLTNIVFMGMGEPLLNYDAVVEAVNIITDPSIIGMSPKRITISTVGIPQAIEKLADDLPTVKLAISLHSADNDLRNYLIPVNKKYDLHQLTVALQRYHRKTGNRISIEYLLLNNINDTRNDAELLTEWTKSFPVKINLIPYNPVPGKNFTTSSNIEDFKSRLENKNLVVNVRVSRGNDIDAACGQLINRNKK